MRHWSVDPGVPNLDKMTILLKVHLNPDGSVASVRVADESLTQYNSDANFHSVADSTIRAVVATKNVHFPPGKYETYKDLKLVFHPGWPR